MTLPAVAVLLGIWAAIMGGHFGRLWPWVSIGVLVVVVIAMTPLAANPMRETRAALGIGNDKSGAPLVPGSDADVATAKGKMFSPHWSKRVPCACVRF